MNGQLIKRCLKCQQCTEIGKNLKPTIPAFIRQPQRNCVEPNKEIQIDFGGPIKNEKKFEVYFLAFNDCYSFYPSAEVFNKAVGGYIVRFLQDYVNIHGLPTTIL